MFYLDNVSHCTPDKSVVEGCESDGECGGSILQLRNDSNSRTFRVVHNNTGRSRVHDSVIDTT